ncbi:MAG TPA: general stress protein [Polyangiaceae bacterium]|nr:general stress protein [Polyangiaceae bacterium]
MDLIYALFSNETQAQKAIQKLVENEFAAANIYVLMRDDAASGKVEQVPVITKTMVGPGVAIGTALGAVGGVLVALTGGLLAAGPIVALLQGASAGGAAGVLAGTLGGLGYWRDMADFPSKHIESGAILVGVDASAQGQAERARAALKAAGADTVSQRTWSEAKADVRHA